MWMYILICLSLSLAGVAGLQFFYMIYLDRIGKDKQNRIRELENHCKNLTARLQEAEMQISEQRDFINSVHDKLEAEEEIEEIWADVIDEG
jgi:chromosome segregation ATPase